VSLGGIQPAAPKRRRRTEEQRGGDGRRSKGEATDGGAKGRRRTEERRGGDGLSRSYRTLGITIPPLRSLGVPIS